VFLPLAVFVGVAAVFLMQLTSGRDAAVIPSALIGRTAPDTKLPPLPGLTTRGIDTAGLTGKVTVLNVWASWCAPCREEHPLLLQLTRDDRFVLAGLDYKDPPEKARAFLEELGNPFDMVGADRAGRAAIDWGVYGVPETFLIDRRGVIVWKQVGPFTPETIERELMPRIEAALAAPN
jgi:cytochrome c biogenesis protein CcmG/thiol:disulfide interchange protein DsbE